MPNPTIVAGQARKSIAQSSRGVVASEQPWRGRWRVRTVLCWPGRELAGGQDDDQQRFSFPISWTGYSRDGRAPLGSADYPVEIWSWLRAVGRAHLEQLEARQSGRPGSALE